MSKRITETQIVFILKEADVGFSAKELCRKYGIASSTFYKWKSKYSGIEASDVKHLKKLKENRRHKQIYADLSLKSQIQEEFIN
ncbi:transposase [Psychrobacter sp. FBL11]|uniref:Transposase n=1 Tax=Psychrobacter saeujeotis TaxID=3143436 RepID=A0ABU9XBP1_9GAMM|nr:transposase [uncultured Psychrobacter sp.]